MHRYNIPKAAVIEPLVVVPKNIANADYRAPRNLRGSIPQLGGQGLCGFRDDLQGAFGRPF